MATILLVEDTPANLALASKLLRAAGQDVLTAETAAGGIALAREKHPDLVLMDLGLPDMNGWDALREIRSNEDTAALRVIAFTAHAMVGDRARVLKAGFDGYLSKPIDFATFADSVDQLLKVEAAPQVDAVAPATQITAPRATPRVSMGRERPLILAVDDEPANLALLRKLLRHQGYDVVEAANGRAALDAITDHLPDLVCLDVMMPDLDGIEVCQQLRHQAEHVGLPILLVTALNRPEDKARGLEAGANDFLSKPFDEIELAARVRSLLRTKALQDRLVDLLGRYVSDSIATEVLRNPFAVSLGGDRRQVSTLCADVRGYTALAAQHTPEQALDLLNRYLSLATDAVESHGGTVGDLLGDGVFAYFGAPVIHSDDPERAVRAALAMQAEVMRLEIPTMPGVRLQTGIGITTGTVIAGNIGSERRMHYAVVGDVVNIAARLQTAAGPGQVLVDEATHQAVSDLVTAQDLGSLRLAGKADWVRTFNVTAVLPPNAMTPG